MDDLAREIANQLPIIDLPDLLIEVNRWCGFTDHLTHPGGATPRRPDHARHLYAGSLRAYMAAGVLVGLLANAVLGAWWLDPAIALVIAALAVREGRETRRGEECCALSPTAADVSACCRDAGCAG